MARKKKERSIDAFVATFRKKLTQDGLVEDRVDDACRILEKELRSELDPTGVLKFTLEHPMLWWWRSKIAGVTDGDTMDVFLDRGFRDTHGERIRLHRVNAWETRGSEKPLGDKAKRWAKKILSVGREILVHTTGPDDRGSFGRWLAQLWVPITAEEDKALGKLGEKVETYAGPRLYGDLVPNIDGRNVVKYPVCVNFGEWLLELGHARPYKKK